MDKRVERRVDLLAVGTAVAALAMGTAAWPHLPAEMAVHFSASGHPDNYVPKPVGVALVPAVTIGTALLLRATFRVDSPESARAPVVVAGATDALLLGLQALVVGWNLGYRPPYSAVLAAIGVWTVALVGYALRVDSG